MSQEVNFIHKPASAPTTSDLGVAEKNRTRGSAAKGLLVINADDWGRDEKTSDRTLECWVRRSISSVSAMVFMSDSERAAQLAVEHGVDAGLHLNFTLPFSSPGCSPNLREQQRKLVVYLTRHSLARVFFHPWLMNAFEYVVKAQFEEFGRLYGSLPERIDGHHHMHLCANVLWARLLPPQTIVRRNFSFLPGEKSSINLMYRQAMDKRLARRHRLTEFLFSLTPFEPQSRLERILSLAQEFSVEVETHPVNEDEYRFLTNDEVFRWAGDCSIAPRFVVPE